MEDVPQAVMLSDLPELTEDLVAIAKGLAVASHTTTNRTLMSLGLQAQTLLERYGLWEKVKATERRGFFSRVPYH